MLAMFSHSTPFLFDVPQFLLAYVALVALVAQIALSHNDKNQCRHAKDDSYTEGLIMNWEIIRGSRRKERYEREARAVESSMNQNRQQRAATTVI